MQLCLFIHLSQKRAETTALLDSGVTENFINMQYAKELHLPTPLNIYIDHGQFTM